MFKNGKDKEFNYISTEEVEKIYNYQKKVFDGKIAEQQKKIDELTDYISARFGENVANSNLATKLNQIEKNIQEIQFNYKLNLEKVTKELKKQIEDENKKIAIELNDMQTESYFKLIQKNENDLEKIRETVAESKENTEKILEIDKLVKEYIKNEETNKQDIHKKLKDLNQTVSKINYSGITSKFDKKIKEESTRLENKIIESNEQIKTDVTKNVENIASLIGNVDDRLSEKIALTSEHLENTAGQIDALNTKISKELVVSNEKMVNLTDQVNILEAEKSNKIESKKIKEELKEKIKNNYNETKIELDNISLAVDVIKNTMDLNYENIVQDVLKLKQKAQTDLENKSNSETNIEVLKKDYNKYVTKINNELSKISKNILSAQKKNLEANQNLQIKIKAYIDNKIIKADNTKKIEELINNLDLSIQEREKVQRLEMEELLNKKIKAIQKENEQILNKKIEEISGKFVKENVSYSKSNPNNVTFYSETPKKKNVYELIDENQILRKSAKNKEPLSTSQDGKSQILKFFYDEDN